MFTLVWLDDLQSSWPHHQAQASSCIAREHLQWTRDQWTSVLLSNESWFMVSRNYGHQRCWRCQGQCSSSTAVVTRLATGGGVVSGRTGVSSQYRSVLLFVKGAGTNMYYLNDAIYPVIVFLHEQQRPNLIFMDYNAPVNQDCIIRNSWWRLGDQKWSGCHFLKTWKPHSSHSLSCRTFNSVLQNLNDLKAALQEE